MRNQETRKNVALASVLCVTVAAVVAGCNDGNGGPLPVPTAGATPIATAGATPSTTLTPRPTATPAAGTTRASNITLGNGQRAVLTLTTRGTAVTGTLRVLTAGIVTQGAGTRAITYAFRVGTYQVTGTFTPPRGYSITGTDGGRALFTMTGQLPTTTQTGSYTLSVNGQTESGVIPVIGSVSPTPTAAPTATAPSGPFASTLTFTPSGGSNFANATISSATFTLVSQANIVGGAIQSTAQAGRASIFLALAGGAASVGTTTPLGGTFPSSGYIYNYNTSTQLQVFVPESGSVTLTALSQNSATYRFNNAVYTANEGNIARGKVTVNGTVTGPLRRL